MGIAVMAICYMAISSYLRYVDKKGQNAYNSAYFVFSENMRPDTNIEQLKESGVLFEEVAEEYGLSKASTLAVPPAAYVKFVEKEYDEAIERYEKFLRKAAEGPFYRSLTNLALAACHEQKRDFKAAIAVLDSVVVNIQDPLREVALLSLSRVYRLDNNPDKSKELLNQFIEEYQDSPFLPLARAKL